MGEVFRPEDFTKKKRSSVRDIKPEFPAHSTHQRIEALTQEIERLNKEIEKLKQVLRAHGIKIN